VFWCFNHLEHPGQRIDEETIQTIHAAVGNKVGRKFFVIAPRGVFDFQQDYIDIEDCALLCFANSLLGDK